MLRALHEFLPVPLATLCESYEANLKTDFPRRPKGVCTASGTALAEPTISAASALPKEGRAHGITPDDQSAHRAERRGRPCPSPGHGRTGGPARPRPAADGARSLLAARYPIRHWSSYRRTAHLSRWWRDHNRATAASAHGVHHR